MTDPNPLREDDVEAVARVIYCAIEGISQEHNQAHLDYWFVSPDPLDANGVDEYRAAARAAITALDQVREGRGIDAARPEA